MHKTLALSLLALSFTASASPQGDWQKTFHLGYGLSQAGHSQDVTLATTPAPGLVNNFDTENLSRGSVLLGFGLSKSIAGYKNGVKLRAGLEVDYIDNSAVAGTVHPLVNGGPNFDTLNFSYDVQSYLLLANLNLSKENIYKAWGGYLNVGGGAAINRLSNYTETTPQGSTAFPMLAPFGNRNKSSAAFTAGFGLSHAVGVHSEVSLGYRYINTGRGSFAVSAVQSTADVLRSASFGHHLLTLSVSA